MTSVQRFEWEFASTKRDWNSIIYANRNELLDQWVNNPETVEQKVWPNA